MRSPAYQKFGNQIRKLRRLESLSQEALAERCGLHRNYVGGIERGERNPSLKNIFVLAHSLGVKPSELLVDVTESDVILLLGETPEGRS